jgi:pre-mRNA-splicing helicase BRR2
LYDRCVLQLNGRTTLKGVLEIITAATEFEDIQIRRHEDHILQRIYDRVPFKMQEPNLETPHFKAFVLLQAHFSRMQLPIDLAKDQEVVIRKVLNILSASVDVLSSEAHLNAMSAMELSQMVVQAMWQKDSPLKQIPHFDNDTIKAAQKFSINDVDDFINAMDEDENPDYKKLIKALEVDQRQLADIANFTNNFYPNIELEHELLDPEDIASNSPAQLRVKITRNIDEDEELKTEVHAPFYPADKTESWWLVVGDQTEHSLQAIKKVSIARKLETVLEFTLEKPGSHKLTLYLVSDSYLGVDQAPTFTVEAAEGMDEDSDEEEE